MPPFQKPTDDEKSENVPEITNGELRRLMYASCASTLRDILGRNCKSANDLILGLKAVTYMLEDVGISPNEFSESLEDMYGMYEMGLFDHIEPRISNEG